MNITYQKALDYLSAYTLTIKAKVAMLETETDGGTYTETGEGDFFIMEEDKVLAECIEMLLVRVKAQGMFGE